MNGEERWTVQVNANGTLRSPCCTCAECSKKPSIEVVPASEVERLEGQLLELIDAIEGPASWSQVRHLAANNRLVLYPARDAA